MNERDLIKRWIEWKESVDRRPFPQKKLAEEAGIGTTYLSTVITGARNAGTKTIARIAAAVGVSVSEFYAGPPDDGAFAGTESDAVYGDESAVPAEAGSYPSPARVSAAQDPRASHSPISHEETGLKFLGASPDRIDRLLDSYGCNLGGTFVPARDSEPIPRTAEDAAPVIERETPPYRLMNSTSRTYADTNIPLLSGIPSGNWRDWIDDIRHTACETVPLIPFDPARAFAVRLDDESMRPVLGAGSLVVADTDAGFASFDGGIGLVFHEGRFKARRVYADGDSLILVPTNPAYLPEAVSAGDAQVFRIAVMMPATSE